MSVSKIKSSPQGAEPSALASVPQGMIMAAGAVLACAGLAAYWNSSSVPFLFDDDLAITNNASIRHLWRLGEVLWPPNEHVGGVIGRPLVNFSLAVNYALGGLNPWGYHAVNLLLHIFSGWALFGLLRRTLLRPVLRERFGAAALPLAFVIALVWMVHPLLTETVTCVIQRTEGMVGLFYLLTLYCFIRSVESARPGRWQAATVVSCLLGMTSKELMVSAPLLVLLYDRTFVANTFNAAWQQRRRLYLWLAATWAPLAGLMLAANQRGGTVGFGLGMSSWQYALKQCEAVVHYLWLCFWPHPLILDYGADVVTNPLSVAPQFLLLALLLAGTVYALRRQPALGFAGAFFFVVLAPSSSIVPLTTQTMAEHRMYLPLAAVIAVTVLAVYAWAGKRSLAAWLVLSLILGGATFARNQDYQSIISIWSDTALKRPNNARAHYNLGCFYAEADRMDDAIKEFNRALDIDPDYADAHNNLGDTLARLGKTDEAMAQFNAVLATHPDNALAHYNLGCSLSTLNQPTEAIAQFAEAVRLQPDYAMAQNGWGIALSTTHRPDLALDHFEAALQSQPDFTEALVNDADALLATGKPKKAADRFGEALQLAPASALVHKHYAVALAQSEELDQAVTQDELAIKLDPTDAETYFNLGNHFFAQNKLPDAVAQFKEALRLKPDYAAGYNNLGAVLLHQQRFDDAITAFSQAVQLDPKYAEAHYNFGNALLITNRFPEAEAQYRAALDINPNYAEAHNNLGSALLKEGNRNQAIVEYQQALTLKPDYADALRNLTRLNAVTAPATTGK